MQQASHEIHTPAGAVVGAGGVTPHPKGLRRTPCPPKRQLSSSVEQNCSRGRKQENSGTGEEEHSRGKSLGEQRRQEHRRVNSPVLGSA